MIENIMVPGTELLNEVELLRLGKINVVCGKNNSGKSTILSSLEPERLSFGKEITEEEHLLIGSRLLSRLEEWPESELDSESSALIPQLVRTILSRKRLWWSSERSIFYEELRAAGDQNELWRGANPLPGPAVTSSYLSIFPRRPASTYVPAKRALDLQSELRIPLRDATGKGVLSALFFGKNQLPGNPQYELHRLVRHAFEDVTSGHSFELSITTDNLLNLSFRNPQGTWLPAASCGLGLQELLVLIYFGLDPSTELLRVEEPENHLHPHFQRRLLRFFREETSKQFFLATHSNIFLDVNLVDRVFSTTVDEKITVTDATSRATLLNDIGYEVGDNLVSDLVVLVEGPSDSAFLQAILSKTVFARARVIKFWPLGGDNMEHLDLSVFAERNRLIALIDDDPGSDAIRKRFVKKCEELRIPIHRLERYSLENYIPVRVLREFYKGQIRSDIQEIPPNESVEKLLNVGIKRNNRRLGELTRLEELAGTDFLDFINKLEVLSAPNS